MGFKTKTFLNNNPPALEDVDLNGYKSEFNNSFTAAGLSPSDGDLQQTAKSMSIHAAGADFYTDSGAADAYVLSPSGSFLAPEAYFVGMSVRFISTNTNTGASTINVDGLGVKNIKRATGSDPYAYSILSGAVVSLYYDGTDFIIDQGVSTDMTLYTPTTQGFGTITNNAAQFKLIDNLLTVHGRFTSGTHTTTEFQIGLPTGLTISSTYDSIPNVVGVIDYDGITTNETILIATQNDVFVNVGLREPGVRNPLSPVSDAIWPNTQDFRYRFSVFVN